MLTWTVVVVGLAWGSEDFDGLTFYFGDMHAHTGVSPDGGSQEFGNCKDDTVCEALADVFDIAKANGLDFVAFTEHTFSIKSRFNDFLDAAVAANDPANGFLTIPAAELWFTLDTWEDLGHKNAFVFSDDDLTGISLDDFDTPDLVTSCSEVWDQAEELEAWGPTLLVAHHPTTDTPMATDWSCHDQTYQPVVEVYSEHGNSLVHDTDFDVTNDPIEDGSVHTALEVYGLRLGFIGGTDNHDTRPGSVCDRDSEHPAFNYSGALTVVALEEGATFNRGAIYNEMVSRRTLVTTGPRMPVRVLWKTPSLAVFGPGDELQVDESLTTELEVRIPPVWEGWVTEVAAVGYSDRFELTEEMEGVWEAVFQNDQLPSWLYVEVTFDGEAFYGSACNDGGVDDFREFIWSSPTWFEVNPDADDDGHLFPTDCDDANATIFPGADEVWYDGIDQDCSGTSDYDADLDGHDATTAGGLDCDDDDPLLHPGALEIWYDGLDQDCDAASDYDQDLDGADSALHGGDDCNDVDVDVFVGATEVWYDGVDQDCSGGSDYDGDLDGQDALVHGGTDCNDLDAGVFLGASETWYDGVDHDCSGGSDYDSDLDGHDALAWGGTDCDDGNGTIYAGAPEVWYDGVDQDCSGGSDYDADLDGDDALGWGGGDCNDVDDTTSSGAAETWYDGIDQDCSGGSDHDQDGDGADATASGGTDCDDVDAAIFVGAEEVFYDGVDQDCTGGSDFDQDGDAYERMPEGTDCEDLDPAIHPDCGEEWYDGVDQDCSGGSDYDQDGDGANALSADGTDCDDLDPEVIACGATDSDPVEPPDVEPPTEEDPGCGGCRHAGGPGGPDRLAGLFLVLALMVARRRASRTQRTWAGSQQSVAQATLRRWMAPPT